MKWHFRDARQWQRWFAWRPVVIEGKYVWLEWAERRLDVVIGTPFAVPFYSYRGAKP